VSNTQFILLAAGSYRIDFIVNAVPPDSPITQLAITVNGVIDVRARFGQNVPGQVVGSFIETVSANAVITIRSAGPSNVPAVVPNDGNTSQLLITRLT
jgi:hypothetical protein